MQPIFEPHKPRQGRKKKGKEGEEEPPDHALGRSRGGLTTKIHLLCDAVGHPLAVTCSLATSQNPHRLKGCYQRYAYPPNKGVQETDPSIWWLINLMMSHASESIYANGVSRLLSQTRRFLKAENGVREDQGQSVIKDYMPNAIS